MDLAAIISEIETIRFNDYQVCEKISLLEAHIDRLKHQGCSNMSNVDGVNWFYMEAQNEQLVRQCEQIHSRSKEICLQFDFELQKLREEHIRKQQLYRQQFGCFELEKKIVLANERLNSTRTQLERMRQEQSDLSQTLERKRRLHQENQTEAAVIQDFLNSMNSYRQISNRLNINQNQLHALERRISNVRSAKTVQIQREANLVGSDRGRQAESRSCRPVAASAVIIDKRVGLSASSTKTGSSSSSGRSHRAISKKLPDDFRIMHIAHVGQTQNSLSHCPSWTDEFSFAAQIDVQDPKPVQAPISSTMSISEDESIIYLD